MGIMGVYKKGKIYCEFCESIRQFKKGKEISSIYNTFSEYFGQKRKRDRKSLSIK